MTKKRKGKKFSAVQAVKALARERIGSPPAEKILADGRNKNRKTEKHKPSLAKLLDEDQN